MEKKFCNQNYFIMQKTPSCFMSTCWSHTSPVAISQWELVVILCMWPLRSLLTIVFRKAKDSPIHPGPVVQLSYSRDSGKRCWLFGTPVFWGKRRHGSAAFQISGFIVRCANSDKCTWSRGPVGHYILRVVLALNVFFPRCLYCKSTDDRWVGLQLR